MASSQLNLVFQTSNYPKLRPASSIPHPSIKSSRLALPVAVPPFRVQTTRRIIISRPIACSLGPYAASGGAGGAEGEDEAKLAEEAEEAIIGTQARARAPHSWVETYIPEKARPYAYLMRLHKFSAGPLITMPCLWSIALTTQPGSIGDAKMLALFLLVGVINRGILCTINDILDRDFDAKVKRTTYRPLASGSLTLFQAISCLALQTIFCYALLLPVNTLSRNLWLASLVLGFTYPLMKRVTFWPQAYLGLVVNSLNFSGWAAVKGSLDPRALIPICASGFFWTIFYDTIYAHQDKADDAKIGVKSTALLMGSATKKWLSGLAVATMGALALTGPLTSIGWPFYASLVAASIHLAWQITTVNLDSSKDCFSKFECNVQFGAIVLSGILLGRLYQ